MHAFAARRAAQCRRAACMQTAEHARAEPRAWLYNEGLLASMLGKCLSSAAWQANSAADRCASLTDMISYRSQLLQMMRELHLLAQSLPLLRDASTLVIAPLSRLAVEWVAHMQWRHSIRTLTESCEVCGMKTEVLTVLKSSLLEHPQPAIPGAADTSHGNHISIVDCLHLQMKAAHPARCTGDSPAALQWCSAARATASGDVQRRLLLLGEAWLTRPQPLD